MVITLASECWQTRTDPPPQGWFPRANRWGVCFSFHASLSFDCWKWEKLEQIWITQHNHGGDTVMNGKSCSWASAKSFHNIAPDIDLTWTCTRRTLAEDLNGRDPFYVTHIPITRWMSRFRAQQTDSADYLILQWYSSGLPLVEPEAGGFPRTFVQLSFANKVALAFPDPTSDINNFYLKTIWSLFKSIGSLGYICHVFNKIIKTSS